LGVRGQLEPMKQIYLFLLFILMTTHVVLGQDWKAYSFKQASFKILFPSTPKTGEENNTFIAASQFDGMAFRAITHLNRSFDLHNASTLLKESTDAFINKGDQILKTKENFKVAGHSAREVEVRTADGLKIVFRAVITPTKLYQFAVAGNQNGFKTENAQKFLDSFSVL
jgi:hypothetical protein